MIKLKELRGILPFEAKIINGKKEKRIVVVSAQADYIIYRIIKGVPNKKFIHLYDKNGIGICYENSLLIIDGHNDILDNNTINLSRHNNIKIEITKTKL